MKFIIEPVDSMYSLTLHVPHKSDYIRLYVSRTGTITPNPIDDSLFYSFSSIEPVINRIQMIWSQSPSINMLTVSDIEYWIDRFNKFPFEYMINFPPSSEEHASSLEQLKKDFADRQYSQFDRYLIYTMYQTQYDQTILSIRKRYPKFDTFKLWADLEIYSQSKNKSLRYYIQSIIFPESMQHELITEEVSAVLTS